MLTLSNCTSVKIKAALPHNNEGSVAYESDSTPDVFIYSKLRADGTPTFDSEAGYTEKQTMIQDGKMLLNTEIEWDFTNEGANILIDPLLDSWKHEVITGLEGKQHFFTPVKDDNETVIGTKNHLIYSSEVTNPCLTKNFKYLRLIPEYLLADVDGNLILDNDNNYIITEDWFR